MPNLEFLRLKFSQQLFNIQHKVFNNFVEMKSLSTIFHKLSTIFQHQNFKPKTSQIRHI